MEDLYALRIGAMWHAFKEQGLAFWLVSFYLFLEYVRPQSIYPVIDILPWAQTAIILALVMRLLTPEKWDVGNVATFFMVAFMVVVLLSAAFAYTPGVASDRITVHATWLIVYLLIVSTVNTETRFFLFLIMFLLWNFKMSQNATYTWALRGFGYASWGAVGAPGWFRNSGEFGITMCMFLPVSLFFVASLKSCWSRAKTIAVSLLPITAGASILASNSRGAILGGLAAILWMMLGAKGRVSALILITLIVLVGYHALPDETLNRFDEAGTDETSENRLARWEAGLEIINKHPVLGVGPANWMEYYTTQFPREEGAEGWGLAHNIFIDAGSEYGLTGLVIFVIMIFVSFKKNSETRARGREVGNEFIVAMSRGLDGALIGFLVSGFFASVFFYPFFWINLSFVIALNKVATRQVAERNPGGAIGFKADDGKDGRSPSEGSVLRERRDRGVRVGQ